jgi:HEAT repeat protein
MQQLAIGSPHVAQKAIEELTRRGFRPRDLRLAERLVNADPDVRLELVNSLPQLSGIDSRPWLIWLSSDPDSLVRRAAVSIIATGDDQALFDHLRQVEQTETDEEVLRLIRRALARR